MIYLARHGQTEFNAPPVRIQGMLDPPLNDVGREQARSLAEQVAGVGLASLYTSSMRRARETGAIVGERIGLEPVSDARFDECGWGRWQGLLVEDIANDEPALWAAWLRAGESFRFPDGESLGEHMERTTAALEDVARGPLPALVVCHGGTIRVAQAARDPRGLDGYHDFHVRNGELVRLDP